MSGRVVGSKYLLASVYRVAKVSGDAEFTRLGLILSFTTRTNPMRCFCGSDDITAATGRVELSGKPHLSARMGMEVQERSRPKPIPRTVGQT